MKPVVRIASHLAALCVGIGIAVSVASLSKPGPTPEPAAGKSSGSPTTGNGTEAGITSKSRKEARPTITASDFRMAWNEVLSRKLAKRERMKIQSQILAEWAQVDLESAMHAVLDEAWDDNSSDPFVEESLIEAFSQAFSDHPLDAWALIQSTKFGMGSEIFRMKWLQAVSRKDGLLVASMLSEFPASLQKQAVAGALERSNPEPDRDAILAKIIDQAGGQHPDWIQEAFKNLPGGGDPAVLRERWTALPAGSNRQVAMVQWGASLRMMDEAKLSAELANIPPETKNEAMKAMLSQITGGSPGLLAAVEFALSSDQWGEVAKSAAPLLASFGELDHMDPVKLAEWGANLPERPDTVATYQNAIRRYIRDDLPRARAWFESMPEGSWQREHGLAEFSQQALSQKNDPTASQWALDTITDPAVKAEASKRRQDWQNWHDQNGGGTH